jgi:hypothetical protein
MNSLRVRWNRGERYLETVPAPPNAASERKERDLGGRDAASGNCWRCRNDRRGAVRRIVAPSHFIRFFREIFGVLPSDFRSAVWPAI